MNNVIKRRVLLSKISTKKECYSKTVFERGVMTKRGVDLGVLSLCRDLGEGINGKKSGVIDVDFMYVAF